jgi:acetyltransferase
VETVTNEARLPAQAQFKSSWKLDDGTDVTIRPICPADEERMVKFHQTLSEDSVQLRYFHAIGLESRTAHLRLSHICSPNSNEIVLVAERHSYDAEDGQIIAVARLSKAADTNEAEFAILVSDQFQHHGLGTVLLRLLTQLGRQARLARINAYILPENVDMQDVAKRAGYKLEKEPDGALLATIELQ